MHVLNWLVYVRILIVTLSFLSQRRGGADATTPAATPATNYPEQKIAILKDSVRTILACLGEDVEREGLLDTPKVGQWVASALSLKFVRKGL